MKTLVIHPKDTTTDFLSPIYADTNCTLIRAHISTAGLKRAIKEHDRIICLGHGTEKGLLGFGRIFVGPELVYLLREKENGVYIWCHADKFVSKYGLKGFVTGMIISEVGEAIDHGLTHGDNFMYNIPVSNQLFAKCVKDSIRFEPSRMLREMVNNYHIEGNSITEYNSKNLFCY